MRAWVEGNGTMFGQESEGSEGSSRSVALLVFLPAAARAGIVAADFVINELDFLARCRLLAQLVVSGRESS